MFFVYFPLPGSRTTSVKGMVEDSKGVYEVVIPRVEFFLLRVTTSSLSVVRLETVAERVILSEVV